MKYIIALGEISGLGPIASKNLIDYFTDAESVYKASRNDLANTHLSDSIVDSIINKSGVSQADRWLEFSDKNNIQVISYRDKCYPKKLHEISAQPLVLYLKGNIENLTKNRSIAIVGTRHPDEYGKSATVKITEELVAQDVNIVSGLAAGIDTISHKIALKSGGTTVAVMGTGIDIIYPNRNRELAEEIARDGAIVTEFPPGTYPAPYNFPRRNRIISGLSLGTVVIEAKEKSGTLITARHALSQNREIFAVPGSIFNERSCGCFNLIKAGAIPVKSGLDIMDSLKLQQDLFAAPKIKKSVPSISLELLNNDELTLYNILSSNPKRLDEIHDRLSIDNSLTFQLLLEMEMKGFIKQLPGQNYTRA